MKRGIILIICIFSLITPVMASTSRNISIGEYHEGYTNFRFLNIIIQSDSFFYLTETLPDDFIFMDCNGICLNNKNTIILIGNDNNDTSYKIKIPSGVWSKSISGKLLFGEEIVSTLNSDIGMVQNNDGSNLPLTSLIPNSIPESIITLPPENPENQNLNLIFYLLWVGIIVIVIVIILIIFFIFKILTKKVINEITLDIGEDNSITINEAIIPQSSVIDNKFEFDYEINNNKDKNVNVKVVIKGNIKKIIRVNPIVYRIDKKGMGKFHFCINLKNKKCSGKIKFLVSIFQF